MSYHKGSVAGLFADEAWISILATNELIMDIKSQLSDAEFLLINKILSYKVPADELDQTDGTDGLKTRSEPLLPRPEIVAPAQETKPKVLASSESIKLHEQSPKVKCGIPRSSSYGSSSKGTSSKKPPVEPAKARPLLNPEPSRKKKGELKEKEDQRQVKLAEEIKAREEKAEARRKELLEARSIGPRLKLGQRLSNTPQANEGQETSLKKATMDNVGAKKSQATKQEKQQQQLDELIKILPQLKKLLPLEEIVPQLQELVRSKSSHRSPPKGRSESKSRRNVVPNEQSGTNKPEEKQSAPDLNSKCPVTSEVDLTSSDKTAQPPAKSAADAIKLNRDDLPEILPPRNRDLPTLSQLRQLRSTLHRPAAVKPLWPSNKDHHSPRTSTQAQVHSLPRKPTSCFHFFLRDIHDQFKMIKKNKKLISHLNKESSRLWNAMSKEEKRKYHMMANDDKNRYEAELRLYEQRAASHQVTPKAEDSNSIFPGFFRFLELESDFIRRVLPEGASDEDIRSECFRRWDALSQSEKLKYKILAADNQATF